MPVDVTAMKNLPSKRGSRLRRARSSTAVSNGSVSCMRRRYAGPPALTSHFRTWTDRDLLLEAPLTCGQGGMTEIRVIRSAEDLAALQPQWWDLWRRAAAPLFLSPAWLLPWWQIFRPGELRSIAVL